MGGWEDDDSFVGVKIGWLKVRKETLHLNKTKKVLVYIYLYVQNNLILSYLIESLMISNEFRYFLKS